MNIRDILSGDNSSVAAFTKETVRSAIDRLLQANSQSYAGALRDIPACSTTSMLDLSVSGGYLRVTNLIHVELFVVAELHPSDGSKVESESFFVPNGVLTLSFRELFPRAAPVQPSSLQLFGLNKRPVSLPVSL